VVGYRQSERLVCQGLSVRASEALALGMIDEGMGVVGAVGVLLLLFLLLWAFREFFCACVVLCVFLSHFAC
jgi:hypothetical protein